MGKNKRSNIIKERKGERPARRVGITIRVFQSWEEGDEEEEEEGEEGELLAPSSEASSFLEPIFQDQVSSERVTLWRTSKWKRSEFF